MGVERTGDCRGGLRSGFFEKPAQTPSERPRGCSETAHPRVLVLWVCAESLGNLFGIELWERFSFYGMQALLAFYMYYATTDGGLGIDRPPP